MRAGGNRLSPVVSTRDCRCSRFVSELGLEIFCHYRPPHRQAVATDQRVPRRQTCSLSPSTSSLPAGQHFIFLCRELRSKGPSFVASYPPRRSSDLAGIGGG